MLIGICKLSYSLSYVIVAALFGIILKLVSLKSHDALSTSLLIFLVSFNSIVIFHIANRKNLGATYRKLLSLNKIDIFLLPTLVTLSLIGVFYIPLHFTPSLHAFTYTALTSCCASISVFFKFKTRSNLLIFLTLSIIIITFYVFNFGQFTLANFLIMVFATLSCAIVSYSYFVLSYRFNQAGLSAIEVLTFRFWPICIIFGIISIISGELFQMPLYIIPETISVSIITFVLPVYLSQKAIEKIGPHLHGMLLGFVPLLTYILENIILGIHNFSMLFFSLALAAMVLLQSILHTYDKKSK